MAKRRKVMTKLKPKPIVLVQVIFDGEDSPLYDMENRLKKLENTE